MEHAIYYPNFEVQNPNWLKFALLYIDRLNPIIPPEGDAHLREVYQRLANETDLLVPYRPDVEQGVLATLDAINLLERILARPSAYSHIFGCANIVEVWRHTSRWHYTLFEAKYTPEWEHFCLQHRLATRSDEGLKLEKSLGFVYMSFLAHAIADSRGVSPITDQPEMDQIAMITRKTSLSVTRRVEVAQAMVRLKLPANLSAIPIERIVAHRKKAGFKDRLHAFHAELANWIADVENGKTRSTFLVSRGNSVADFSDDIMRIGAGVVQFGLGVWFYLQAPVSPDCWKQLGAGTVLTVSSTLTLRQSWKHTKPRRLTRKYLASLQELNQ